MSVIRNDDAGIMFIRRCMHWRCDVLGWGVVDGVVAAEDLGLAGV